VGCRGFVVEIPSGVKRLDTWLWSTILFGLRAGRGLAHNG
jgi:hypothetical protein